MALRAYALREFGVWEEKRAKLAASQTNGAGAFAGYASVFGVADSIGDVIMPGAFAPSLQRRGASGVKMLWQHQASEPIGVWTRLVEDRRGLKVEGQLDLSVARAREALSLMRSGAVDGLSIGFKTKRATLDKQNGLRKLLEVDLWEISIVTFPALESARIESAKRRGNTAPATIDVLMTKLARLKAHRAAEDFEHRLRIYARTLERRYSSDQPRVPAGSREGGRWTSGGGGSATPDVGQAPADQTALNVDPNVASDAGSIILAGGFTSDQLDMSVQDFVASFCKGSLNSELPGQFLNSTVGEVLEEAKNGGVAAKKCKKLLTQDRFRK